MKSAAVEWQRLITGSVLLPARAAALFEPLTKTFLSANDGRLAPLHFRAALFLFLLVAAVMALPVHAASRAMIIVGLTGGPLEFQRNQEVAGQIKECLLAQHLDASAITAIGLHETARRETILAALKAHADEFDHTWIFLLGTIAPGHGGEPSLQTAGPRLNATDFAQSIDALPGKKSVVIATSSGGGFLRPLGILKNVESVSATEEKGEPQQPYFPEAWAAAAQEHPETNFRGLALEAAKRVTRYYSEQNLAQPEHSVWFDPTLQEIVRIETAENANEVLASSKNIPEDPAPSLVSPVPTTPAASVVDKSLQPKPASDSFRSEAPTPESIQLIADGKKLAAHSDYAAIVLRRDDEITVDASGAALETHRLRSFVRTGDAIDELATVNFPSAPNAMTRLISARVVRPDGSQRILFRPVDIARGTKPSSEQNEENVIQLPNVSVGCVIEVAWKTERAADEQLDRFYREWLPVSSYPVIHDTFVCIYPAAENWHICSPHSTQAPVISRTPAGSMQAVWTDFSLAPLTSLPADPALRDWRPWVGLSAFDSWTQVSDWYRRLTLDALTTAPAIKSLADEIRATARSREAQIEMAYQKVSELRYVAIELGIGAIRPRAPADVLEHRFGDCKDKASLLVILLQELGIPADFALVNRQGTTLLDFPGWQFNHAIVRVPNFYTTPTSRDLWLDATDRIVPFGVLSPGIAGRSALIISSAEGAHFSEVALGNAPASVWNESWKIKPAQLGPIEAEVRLSASGAAETTLRRQFADLPPPQRVLRAQMLLMGSHPAFSVTNVTMGDPYDAKSSFEVKLQLQLQSAVSPRPNPPDSSLWFATSERDRPLLSNSGQIAVYEQHVEVLGTNPCTLAADINQTTAGMTFSRQHDSRQATAKIRFPETAISPQDYPAARAAWLHFCATPDFSQL